MLALTSGYRGTSLAWVGALSVIVVLGWGEDKNGMSFGSLGSYGRLTGSGGSVARNAA